MDINISGGTPITSVEKKNENINIKKNINKTEWLKPNQNPTLKEEITFFGKALEILIVKCMKNQICSEMLRKLT